MVDYAGAAVKLGGEVAQEEARVTKASVVGQEEEKVGVETQFGKEIFERSRIHQLQAIPTPNRCLTQWCRCPWKH